MTAFNIDKLKSVPKYLSNIIPNFDRTRVSTTGIFVRVLNHVKQIGNFKDTQMEKPPLNKTLSLTKSKNMGNWVVGKSNQFFVRGF